MTIEKKFKFESKVSFVGMINDKWKREIYLRVGSVFYKMTNGRLCDFVNEVSSVGLINDKCEEI